MRKTYIVGLNAFETNSIKIIQGNLETVLQFLNDKL